MKFAQLKLSKCYAEVTPIQGMLLTSAHSLDPFRKLWLFRKWENAMNTDPEDLISNLTNNKRHLERMWGMNTAPTIDIGQWLNLQGYQAALTFPLQQLLDLVIVHLVNIIWPVIMKNNSHHKMWLKGHPNEAIAQYTSWQLQGPTWIHHLNCQSSGGELF